MWHRKTSFSATRFLHFDTFRRVVNTYLIIQYWKWKEICTVLLRRVVDPQKPKDFILSISEKPSSGMLISHFGTQLSIHLIKSSGVHLKDKPRYRCHTLTVEKRTFSIPLLSPAELLCLPVIKSERLLFWKHPVKPKDYQKSNTTHHKFSISVQKATHTQKSSMKAKWEGRMT